jgi:predicted ArsR family transcriptional regulator
VTLRGRRDAEERQEGENTVPDLHTTPRPRTRPIEAHALEHAALASPIRHQLLERLTASDRPLHLADLAEGLGLHPSTVRGHLALLEDAGFVGRLTDHQGRPGRPPVRYRATRKARSQVLGLLGYRTLADVLTSYLHREADDPTAAGLRAGRMWASALTRSEPDAPQSRAASLARVAGLLDGVGFPTEVRGEGSRCVLLQPHCPFADAVDDHGAVVCSVHLGLVDGLLEAMGSSMVTSGLVGLLPSRTCAVRLRRRAPSGV